MSKTLSLNHKHLYFACMALTLIAMVLGLIGTLRAFFGFGQTPSAPQAGFAPQQQILMQAVEQVNQQTLPIEELILNSPVIQPEEVIDLPDQSTDSLIETPVEQVPQTDST